MCVGGKVRELVMYGDVKNQGSPLFFTYLACIYHHDLLVSCFLSCVWEKVGERSEVRGTARTRGPATHHDTTDMDGSQLIVT